MESNVVFAVVSIVVIIAVVIIVIFLLNIRREGGDPPQSERLLWVPIEHWSEFGDIVAPLSNFRDVGDIRGHTDDKPDFEWVTQPDIVRDAMWVKYTCRKPEWEDYLRKGIEKLNERSENPIKGYYGDLPSFE